MARPKVWTHEAFEVRPSTIAAAGLGLFSRVYIGIEETIGYYTGEIITWEELNGGRFSGSDYILALTSTLLIVGEGPKANYTRYINHSPSPNAFLIVSTRWKTARFEAIRDIAPGDEIFFNYGEDYWVAAGNPPA
ncbi:MAG TPA: SET domain-containing protein-lysine N-methyltransferase [Oceanipulchritudo sp.]|nr:SET domain-containing protein-lysine N-methyltransferase [Oceanipulchritudo sp.]